MSVKHFGTRLRNEARSRKIAEENRAAGHKLFGELGEIYARQNSVDLEWLGCLLAANEGNEEVEVLILESIEWLRVNSSRELSVSFRSMFASIEIGKEIPPETKRFVDAARRNRIVRLASRPAWMSDPALLPKRPPPRRPAEVDE